MVTLSDPSAAQPTFTAPTVALGGETLSFELTVTDNVASSTDTVSITVVNVNHTPVADAGSDQSVAEGAPVSLNGAGSFDIDLDAVTYAWVQVAGPAVALAGADTATPSFTTPFVTAGGADLTFALTVNDGYGSTAGDTVVLHVQNANDPPLVSAAQPTDACLWPPNHRFVLVGITGVSDPDANATITIDRVTQDEPTNGRSDGDTPIDAVIQADGTVLLRAERAGNGDGRVYHIHFTATDLEGSASGIVTVAVPRNRTGCRNERDCPATDGGELFDSTIDVPSEPEHAKGDKKTGENDDDDGKKDGKKDSKKDGKKDSKDDDHGKKDSKKGKK